MKNKCHLLMTMFVIIALFPSVSFAMRATTDADSVACLTKSAIEEMVQFTASGDRESFDAYIAQKKCIIVRGGLDVTVVEPPGMFGGITGFVFRGVKMWTTRQGLTNYRVE